MAKKTASSIADAMGVDIAPYKEPTTLHLTEDVFKGISDLTLDQKVTLVVEGTVTSINRGSFGDKGATATITIDEVETKDEDTNEDESTE